MTAEKQDDALLSGGSISGGSISCRTSLIAARAQPIVHVDARGQNTGANGEGEDVFCRAEPRVTAIQFQNGVSGGGWRCMSLG